MTQVVPHHDLERNTVDVLPDETILDDWIQQKQVRQRRTRDTAAAFRTAARMFRYHDQIAIDCSLRRRP